MNTCNYLKSAVIFLFLLVFLSTAEAEYNDYAANKPSAFRDHEQTMIWDSEILGALAGFQGQLMFSTGSCFSGGFVDDLTQLARAVVVTSNTWHGFGMSLYDFIPGETSTYAFHNAYMDEFRWDGQGAPPTYAEAYTAARDTVHTGDGPPWSWGGVEHPQFGATGGVAGGTLEYVPGDRAILFSGMWAGNEYYLSSWDHTIAGGRDMLLNDYGWAVDAVTTLFSDGAVPPERSADWLSGAGSKANLLNALAHAAGDLSPANKLLVFVIAHGRSSAIMTSRLLADRRTIEYLLIPNGKNIAADDDSYPAASYGCTQIEINGLRDSDPSHYSLELPDSLNGWTWRIDPSKQSLWIEAIDPDDQATWLEPGREYHIQLTYHQEMSRAYPARGGWTLWLPEGGGGPPFTSDTGEPGQGWGIGLHVPGTPALGSPDPSAWEHGWETGGDGWILIPSIPPAVPAFTPWGLFLMAVFVATVGWGCCRKNKAARSK